MVGSLKVMKKQLEKLCEVSHEGKLFYMLTNAFFVSTKHSGTIGFKFQWVFVSNDELLYSLL